ncbi:MAG: ComF family protein, partial [Alphaproteobacteria bacterium]|nr:ComF family protein [Alphaproteobacteria bacterium]
MSLPLTFAGRWERLAAGLRAGATAALDLVLPPRCLACHGAVARQGALCARCWSALQFLGEPQCVSCGLPFDFDPGEPSHCGSCLRKPPPFDRARAALAYDDGSRPLLLAFKHADRTHAAPPFGQWLARAAGDLLGDTELIVPVPLHRWRLVRRRYNQAALLAHALGRAGDLPVEADLLVRRRATPSQAGRSRLARQRNVRGAFAV